ncbi:MAG: family 10 glycosylhydrolase [Bacteroidales bacterium]|nr:family 10 glycosylhydrolase [Bacteroidales bacterium]
MKYQIKSIIFIFLLLNSLQLSANPPKHEIRAAWLTVAWRLDWPSTIAKDTLSAGIQRDELVKILDHLHFLNFNTVFLQVRMRNDVIYPSQIEPWSAMISGKNGKSPSYDPLAFAIAECHKRGLECHAWIVTIPIGNDKQIKESGNVSLVKKHPTLCKRIKGEWFLDPGEPGTAQYLSEIVSEITKKYDVDGIHLDYLRYPEIGEFPDTKTKKKYGDKIALSDWRRANINKVVSSIYDTVKAIKPWVQVSSSPIGKYKDLDSISSLGWNGYNKVYQDVKFWITNQKQDFIAPMMYFKEPIFKPFMRDWKSAAGKHPVVGGIALYMMDEHKWPLQTIENEINFTREINSGGQCYFRTQNLIKNTKLCADYLKMRAYLYPALMPAMTWIDSIAPPAPKFTRVWQKNNRVIFEWETDSNEQNITFNLYKSNKQNIKIDDITNLIACRIKSKSFEMEIPDDYVGNLFFVVTANDQFHNESLKSLPIKVLFK